MTGAITIHTAQDVTDRIDLNKAIHADTDERARYDSNSVLGVRMASIPLSVFMDLQKRMKVNGSFEECADFRKWLNDPDNRFFRTRPGRM